MKILDSLLNLIAPHDCIKCGKEGILVCDGCRLNFMVLPARCYKCLKLSPQSRTCVKCRRASKLSYVWAVTEYEGIAETLVKRFKFVRTRAAVEVIATEMSEKMPYLQDYLVTHVPTSPARVRARGYDQARLIAKTIAREQSMQYSNVLHRLGNSRQVGATRSQRRKQAEHMFRLANDSIIKNRNILIVDDIITTGATLESAADVLKKGGAKSVSALVFAQKTV